MARKILSLVAVAAALVACEGQSSSTDAAMLSPEDKVAATSPVVNPTGKPTPPVSLAYEILGRPAVGQPIAVEISLISEQPRQTINVRFRSNDASGLLLAEAQPDSLSVTATEIGEATRQQVMVVPQREGRVFLNIEAELLSEGGAMSTVMAVPLDVGTVPSINGPDGELKTDSNGDLVRSMPAVEN